MTDDVADFKTAVSRFPTGVTVIATSDGTNLAGMTANAIFSLSLSPPSVVVSLQNDAETTRLIGITRKGAVSFLSADQRHVSETFSRRNSQAEKFRTVPWLKGNNGQPIIEGCISALEIAVQNIIPAADHQLVIANVTRVVNSGGRLPLIYYASSYATMEPDGKLVLPQGRRNY